MYVCRVVQANVGNPLSLNVVNTFYVHRSILVTTIKGNRSILFMLFIQKSFTLDMHVTWVFCLTL